MHNQVESISGARILLVLCLLFIGSICLSQIIEVPFDQPTIQDAIDVSVAGDTILVSPGIYEERVIIEKNNITITSLFLTTGDTSYISQTIIKNTQGIACYFEDVDSSTILMGFTIRESGMGISCSDADPKLSSLIIEENFEEGGIQLFESSPTIYNNIIRNNSSSFGGGIYMRYGSNPVLIDCLIEKNYAESGGGLYCMEGSLDISGSTIRENEAIWGGGLCWNISIAPAFNATNKCNVYLNTADIGNDIYINGVINGSMILDTFSVLHPSNFYVTPLQEFDCEINAGKITQVDSDLYVSPAGDNSNSGLSASDPLQTIHYANSIIQADSNSQHTIHLQEGTYSYESNNERFPINFQDYTNLQGIDMEEVILDAEGSSSVINAWFNYQGVLSNLTVQNGSNSGIYLRSAECIIDHITVKNNTGQQGGGIYCNGCGITLENSFVMNNSASWGGGGLFAKYGSPFVKNTMIRGNTADVGGGIDMRYAHLSLSGVSLMENDADNYGGGIFNLGGGELNFDSLNRCNIYSNKAACGNELYTSDLYGVTKVWVDTFTVMYPTTYHAALFDKFEFDILYGFHQQEAYDLYVSPEGDDNNSGLSQNDPLKTIDFAACILLADAGHKGTIHLLDGLYSPSSNEERFPIGVPEYFDISGASKNGTILDAENENRVMFIADNTSSTISYLTVKGGKHEYGAGIRLRNASPLMMNLNIIDNIAERGAGLYLYNSHPMLQNLNIHGNQSSGCGAGMYLAHSNPHVVNSVIANNYCMTGGGGISGFDTKANFINVTIANNEALFGGGIYLQDSYAGTNDIELTNSILYGNIADEVYIQDNDSTDVVTVLYCNLQGGLGGIIINGYGIVHWLEGNIDQNPAFSQTADHPYSLSSTSQCIDAGNPDTNGLMIPGFDIMNNVRVWDGDGNGTPIIDMGAYEYGAPVWVEINEYPHLNETRDIIVNAYPNPFRNEIKIEYHLDAPSLVNIHVLDSGGEILYSENSLQAKGSHQFNWNARKQSPGLFVVQIDDGINIDSIKILKVE